MCFFVPTLVLATVPCCPYLPAVCTRSWRCRCGYSRPLCMPPAERSTAGRVSVHPGYGCSRFLATDKEMENCFLKGTPDKGASWSKSIENVQICPFAVSYGCSINVYAANYLNISILGCRHVGSPFTNFDQKKVER